jgi:hypothetical protein
MGGGALFINTYRRAAVVVFIYYNISGGAAAVFIIYSLIIKGDERGIYLLKCVRGRETKCFRMKIAIWPKIGQSNSFDSTRWCTSGQEWPCALFRKLRSGLGNSLGT